MSADKLPPESSAMLKTAGVTTFPVQLWLDGQGRLVKTYEEVTIRGHATGTTTTFGRFNAPVTITPPPASQIGG